MQCCASSSACSTSASWSSSRRKSSSSSGPASSSSACTFLRLRCRDASSWQLSVLRTFRHSVTAFHSVVIVEEHEDRHSLLAHSRSVSRSRKKQCSNLAAGSAAAPSRVSSPPFESNAIVANDLELTGLQSRDHEWNQSNPVFEQTKGGASIKRKQWTCVKEEVSNIVVHFLEDRGLSTTLSATAVKNAPTFITHLLSLLQTCFPDRYLSGKKLSGNEIKSVLLPYLENLDDVVTKDLGGISSNFPIAPGPPDLASFVPHPPTDTKDFSKYPLLLEYVVDGKVPPFVSYCLNIGLNPAQVEATIKKFPPIIGYSFEQKIGKVVAFILGLEVSPSLIPIILLKRPQLFGCNVEQNLRPHVNFLVTLGVDQKRWGRILVAFPHMLTYSCTKYALVFDFLMEIGISKIAAGKVLSKFPHVVGYSVELKLKPMVEYFHSIGIEDLSRVITRSPQTLGLSLEGNIKPTIEFFISSLDFSIEEMALVLTRFPQILGLNVEHNLEPKWQFFLRMKYSRTELVDFPQYFGYSLENRIQPRYKILVERKISWTLNRMLCLPSVLFSRLTSREDLSPDDIGG